MASRFLLSYLWLCFVVVKVTSASRLFEEVEAGPGNVLFSPRRILGDGGGLGAIVVTWTKNSRLRPSQSLGPATVPLTYWLLLLAGDIERNPGPVKHPCKVCQKPVKNDHQGLCCDRCDKWLHAGCCSVSHQEYQRLSAQGESWDWFCPSCTSQELPFSNSSFLSTPEKLAISQCTPIGNLRPTPFGLKCLCFNARSIVNKRNDLKALLLSTCPHVVGITESFLDEEIMDPELVDGAEYEVFRRDRNRHGGGVMLIVHKSIPTSRRRDLETNCELLWVQLTLPRLKLLVGVYYRPPGSSSDHIIQLSHSLAAISDACPVVLCGDFNVANIDWDMVSPTSPSREATQLCDIVQDNSLYQLVDAPNRGNRTLDLLLSNRPDLLQAVNTIDGLPASDHDGIEFEHSLLNHEEGVCTTSRKLILTYSLTC